MQLNSCAKGTNSNNPESSEAKFRVNKLSQVNESANGTIGISLNHKRPLNPLRCSSHPSRLLAVKIKFVLILPYRPTFPEDDFAREGN
ncbi:hypothetical protein SAMN04489723_10711 [Algoriphagus aquimarinus]|uniref:Uncharacterized protein n=1 Tax=Algoriphagus aquimarinus TaxID=237018 RepID=A0A1I0ZX84_9BACT|nr:hypothetical protein SAMN04489723_10711 [Algoriphagus aquimarinus]